MPFDLTLSTSLRRAGWKVKIREKETREPPHVSILRQTDTWRINLRTGEFMDRLPKPSDVPTALIDLIRDDKNWKRLRKQWDRKYPGNPVSSEKEPDDDSKHDTTDNA